MDNKDDSKEPEATPMLVWDIAANPDHIKYSNGNRTAELIGSGCTIRTPFFKFRSTYCYNIKVHVGGHLGIGILNKLNVK